MVGKTWRYLGVGLIALGLMLSVSGCSLSTLLLPPQASPAPSAPVQSGPETSAGLVGAEVFYAYKAPAKDAAFTVVPAAAGAYLDGMGQLGALDTSASDPTIDSLTLVTLNFKPGDVVNVTLYNHQGTISGILRVRAGHAIDVSSYNATSVRLSATSTATGKQSPVPVAYLYQMKNSSGTTFTFTVPPLS